VSQTLLEWAWCCHLLLLLSRGTTAPRAGDLASWSSGSERIFMAVMEVLHQTIGLLMFVWVCLMFIRLHKADHREEVNWAPRSDVMTPGAPNLLTYP
jgi:hypothetical protein